MNVAIETDYKKQGGIQMSTTSKIKAELVRLLNLEENKAGLTVSEVWEKLEQSDFKSELYNSKGEKRAGTLVGLTTRIKQGKVEGLKVIKNSANNLVYVSSSNQVDFLVNQTEKYLKEATNFKLKTEDFSAEQRKVIENYGSILTKLQEENIKLKKVSDEVEKAKLDEKVEPALKEKDVEKPKEKVTAEKTKKEKPEVKTNKKTTDTAKK